LAPAKAKKKGKELRNAFLEAIPGLEQLTEAIKVRATSDVLIGLDGRPIRLQGKGHVGLNYLLQSSGATVCKRWGLILFQHLINDFQFKYGQDFTLLAFIHDSWGLSVKPDGVDTVKRLLELSIVEAGEFYKLRVPMAAEPKVGSSWKDVH
jgi:DNA polymerase I-like protein with 3'-5' exonuclease and polymerase domains